MKQSRTRIFVAAVVFLVVGLLAVPVQAQPAPVKAGTAIETGPEGALEASGSGKIQAASTANPLDLGLPQQAVDKLDDLQLYDLIRQKIHAERQPVPNTEMEDVLIIFFFYITVILLVGFSLLYRLRKDKQLHQTIRAMVEKGTDIPSELLTPRKVRKNTELKSGVILLMLGLGFSLFLLITAIFQPEAMQGVGVGLVPAAIGAGLLIVWRINKKNGDTPHNGNHE